MLLRYLVKENDVPLTSDDVDFISDLIVGHNEPYKGTSRILLLSNPSGEWMFDIINNKRNSIDVDKFDYIMRDT